MKKTLFLLAAFVWSALLAHAAEPPLNEGALPAGQFVNPIAEGADPWVVRDPKLGRYLWCLSEGNRAIAIHAGRRLTALGPKTIVWSAPETGPVSREIWAPELHFLDGRWHIYFAASDGRNENHRSYVLRSETPNPLGKYELHGPLATGDGADGRSPNVWAIDMTPLELDGKRYAIWSGWDAPGTDRQFLYIAPMKSATELAGPRVRLCSNDDFPWEFTENDGKGRGLNEGPQVVQNAGRTFVLFSCGASWLPTYRLGRLELTGRDPLDPSAWTKHKKPVFTGNVTTYGVGHSCIVETLRGSAWWHVFHAKRDRRPGWRRGIFAQPMHFSEDGAPILGQPVAPGRPLDLPYPEKSTVKFLSLNTRLRSVSDRHPFSYYGHHQFIKWRANGVHLGIAPDRPINAYRSGEKLALDGSVSVDLIAEVSIDFLGNAQARDAGILFRTTGLSVGYDAHRGYFAGVIPKTGLVILGKTNGRAWKEIARAKASIDSSQSQRLRVEAKGETIVVLLNGRKMIEASDSDYSTGTVGLRVVDTHAVFSDFKFAANPNVILPLPAK
ncbi:MAG: family 43 glycosylhydrolase [Verrucomicrobiia bacterium]|jgi:GH43 family beta-xylosidase